MGTEHSQSDLTKPETSSLKLRPSSSVPVPVASLTTQSTLHSNSSKPYYSPRSPITPHSPLTPSLIPSTSITAYRSSSSASNTQFAFNHTLSKRDDSLSYSQKLGLRSDSLPKKLNDDEIINKNNGRISSKNKKKKRIFTRSQSYEKTGISYTSNSKSKSRSRANASGNMNQTKRVHNGITGKYISEKIANCACRFWIKHMDPLQRSEQLEIGCVQYFYLLEQYPDLNRFFKRHKIEETALRFFDMFGWLIRSLCLNVNLWNVLAKIGAQHIQMGIKVKHYGQLLEAFHYAMADSFAQSYTIQVKYCIDQIYTIATCIMTGRQYDQLSFGERVLELNQCDFLNNLSTCLEYDIGREYLYRYLGQSWCSEIVVFLRLYQEYQEMYSQHHIERFLKAKDIADASLSPNSTFPINISYAATCEFWARLKICEEKYNNDRDTFEIDPMLFKTVWVEVTQLILSNHWVKFTETIKKMQKHQQSLI